jgi:hypothetical protein
MANTKKVDKPCEDCGVLMEGVSHQKRLCCDCARKREKARIRTYKIIVQKKPKPVLKGTPIINPHAKYCKGCVYWGGDYLNNYCCNYIFCEGHSRPCPPGKDCTEKVVGKRKRLMEFGESRG